jgi:hypothetical protein
VLALPGCASTRPRPNSRCRVSDHATGLNGDAGTDAATNPVPAEKTTRPNRPLVKGTDAATNPRAC